MNKSIHFLVNFNKQIEHIDTRIFKCVFEISILFYENAWEILLIRHFFVHTLCLKALLQCNKHKTFQKKKFFMFMFLKVFFYCLISEITEEGAVSRNEDFLLWFLCFKLVEKKGLVKI